MAPAAVATSTPSQLGSLKQGQYKEFQLGPKQYKEDTEKTGTADFEAAKVGFLRCSLAMFMLRYYDHFKNITLLSWLFRIFTAIFSFGGFSSA
jgi:hypothetical protein